MARASLFDPETPAYYALMESQPHDGYVRSLFHPEAEQLPEPALPVRETGPAPIGGSFAPPNRPLFAEAARNRTASINLGSRHSPWSPEGRAEFRRRRVEAAAEATISAYVDGTSTPVGDDSPARVDDGPWMPLADVPPLGNGQTLTIRTDVTQTGSLPLVAFAEADPANVTVVDLGWTQPDVAAEFDPEKPETYPCAQGGDCGCVGTSLAGCPGRGDQEEDEL